MSDAAFSEQLAKRRIDRFERLHDRAYRAALLDLASHAALPAALTADLVHLLRINFLSDAFDDVCASTSEADLLLSPLCYEISDSLYEMEPVVREKLLQRLVNDHSYARLRDVACLLSEYTHLSSSWSDRPPLKRAQYLTALNILRPMEALIFLREGQYSAAEEGLDENWFVAMDAALARQAAVIDKEDSFGGLADLDKRTLVGLTLFPAPVSRSAWASIVGVDEASFNEIIVMLEEQGLVWRDPEEDRYSLRVPRPALRYLVDHPDLLDELRGNWVKYYVDFVGRNGGKNRRGYAALDGDLTNLKYALHHVLKRWKEVKHAGKRAAQKERSALAHNLVDFGSLLMDYLGLRRESGLSRSLLLGAVEAADELDQPELVGKFAYAIGWTYCDSEEFGAAREWAQYAQSHQNRTRKGAGYPLRLLARIERKQFESKLSISHPSYARIEDLLQEAERAFAQDGDTDGRARAELDWARLAMDCGEYEKARKHFGRARIYFQTIEDTERVAIALENIADTFRREGQRPEARRYYQQALDVARRVGAVEVIDEAVKQLARLS